MREDPAQEEVYNRLVLPNPDLTTLPDSERDDRRELIDLQDLPLQNEAPMLDDDRDERER